MIARELSAKPSGRKEPGSVKYWRVFEQRGMEAANTYARRTAENAVAFVAANPPIRDRTEAFLRLQQIQSAAWQVAWGTHGGPGARRALEGAFIVAERVGGLSFGLALREWGELVGQDKRDVETNRNTLVRTGWLHRNPADRPGRTGRYSLRTPRDIHSHGISECPGLVARDSVAHDAWEGWDMGWYLLGVLSSGSRSVRELALQTGTRGDEDDDDLMRLLMLGLVERDRGRASSCARSIPAPRFRRGGARHPRPSSGTASGAPA
jgi:hypothetical protein